MTGGLWHMASRNLSRNKRRNLATASAVALGVAGLMTLLAYQYREENVRRVFTVYTSHIGHLTIYKKGGFDLLDSDHERYSLSEDEVAKIRTVVASSDNVDLHGSVIIGQGLVGNSCQTMPFMGLGIEPQLERQLRQHPQLAKWSPEAAPYLKGHGPWEYPADFSGIVLSSGLAKLLHKERVYAEVPKDQPFDFIDCKSPDVAQKVAQDSNIQLSAAGWTGALGMQDGEVVAQLSTGNSQTNSNFLLAPLNYMQRLYGTTHVSNYSVWLKDDLLLPWTKSNLEQRLAAAGLAVDVHSFKEEAIAPFYSGTLQFIRIVVVFLGGVMSLIVVFSVFNSATITALERSSEIGMMRSLGYTRRRIRIVFLMEACLLTVASIAIGCGLGFILLFSLNHGDIRYAPPGMDIAGGNLSLVVDPPAVALSWAIIFGLSILTTLFSVWAVAKLPIARLLSGSSR